MTELMFTAFAVFLLAGTIKGTLGIGLPTASISLLVQVIDARSAIVLAIFPILFSNAWQVYRAGELRRSLADLWPVSVVLVVTLFATALFAARLPTSSLALVIGVVIALTNLLTTIPPLAARYDLAAQLPAGFLSGLMGGLTAIWAPPLVIYLLARRVDKEDFVRAIGLLLFVGSLPLCIGYWQNGLLGGELAALSALMIVPTVIGFSLGEVLRRRLDAARFRNAVLIFFLLMGLNLIRRALF